MLMLAVMQAGAAWFVAREGNLPLALVYALYGASNIAMIWVHRG
jgi:hypothetical protein